MKSSSGPLAEQWVKDHGHCPIGKAQGMALGRAMCRPLGKALERVLGEDNKRLVLGT